MPPEMPTDIQRLIARMMEAGVSAEEAIPTMANGGILDLLKEAGGRGVRRAVDPIGHAVDVARDVPEALESLGDFDPHKYFGSRAIEPDTIPSRPDQRLEAVRGLRGMFDNIDTEKRRHPLIPGFLLQDRLRQLKQAGKVRGGLEALLDRARGGLRDRMEGMPRLPIGRGGMLEPDSIPQRYSGGVIGLQAGGDPYQQRMVQSYVSPEVAQPYADLVGQIGQVGAQPYTPYTGQRLAATTPEQATARAAYYGYGTGQGPQGTIQAQSTLGQAAQGVGSMIPQQQALASQFGTMAPQALTGAQTAGTGMQNLAGRAELQGQLAGAGMRQTGAGAQAALSGTQDPVTGAWTPGGVGLAQQAKGQAGQDQMTGLGGQMGAAGRKAYADQFRFGQDMKGMGTAAQTLGTGAKTDMATTGTTAQEQAATAAGRMRELGGQDTQLGKSADMSDYMSQYTRNVTDPQLQQLLEFQKMQGQELGSQAAGAGAFGGYRQGVEASEQAKAVSQQAADIIGKGQQEAFQSAVGREQEDARRREQAQQVGLSAEQQAAQTQAGAQGQMLAAQQAGVGAAQRGTEQQMQAQQQAAQIMDTAAGRKMQGIQGQGALAAQGIGMGMQGLAAQQAATQQGAQLALQGQQQGYGAAQGGTSLGLQGLQAAQAARAGGYGTSADLLRGQQGAMGQQMGAYGQLAGIGGQQMALGGQQQQQQLQRLQAMEQAGARTQQEQQRDYDIAYEDFQRQQRHPQEQTQWQLEAMSRLPYQNTQVIGDYGADPGLMSDVTGAMGAHEEFQSEGAAPTDPATPDMFEGDPPPGGEADSISGEVIFDSDTTNGTEVGGNPLVEVRGGGYIGSSGILAPYHKKLLDGLYAGGRIAY